MLGSVASAWYASLRDDDVIIKSANTKKNQHEWLYGSPLKVKTDSIKDYAASLEKSEKLYHPGAISKNKVIKKVSKCFSSCADWRLYTYYSYTCQLYGGNYTMREASRELIRRRRWGNRKKAASFIISPVKGHDLQYAHTMQNINGHYLSFWRAFTPFVISMAIYTERERDSDCVKVEVYVWVALEKYYLKTSHSKLYGAVWDGAHI